MKFLVIGYGNPGRRDDGLGPAAVEDIEQRKFESVATDSDYQLNIEYAVDIAGYDVVIFIDADGNCAEPFEFKPLQPEKKISHTTHSMSPGSVLALAEELNPKVPEAYLMAVRGYSFEIGEGLTEKAAHNLEAAVEFLVTFIHGKMPGRDK